MPKHTDAQVAMVAPVDPFDGVRFELAVAQLAQRLFAPYMVHKDRCVETCTCGLQAAVHELKRQELLAQRYGTIE